MKSILLICSLIIICIQGSGLDTKKFFFDEISISANKTILKDDNTEDRYGFGIGVYHSFMPQKKINLITGVEYNKTSQFKKSMYEGNFANSTDLNYNINCISVPFGLRFNFGNKMKLLIETGGYADIIVNSNRTGTMHTYFPGVDINDYQIDEKTELSSCVGAYLGLGMLVPISKIKLIIKPDYKFGINKLYSYQDDILNRYFRLTVGLRFD